MPRESQQADQRADLPRERSVPSDPFEGLLTPSPSLIYLVNSLGEEALPSGDLARRLILDHRNYLDTPTSPDVLTGVGALRSPVQHIATSERAWATGALAMDHGRTVIVGLALSDPELARALLLTGIWSSILRAWPKDGAPDHAPLPTWERLSPEGQVGAFQVPALGTSLGAPPEWEHPISVGPGAQLVWSPGDSEVGVFDEGNLRRVDEAQVGEAQPALLRVGTAQQGATWGSTPEGPVLATVGSGEAAAADPNGVIELGPFRAGLLGGDGHRFVGTTDRGLVTVEVATGERRDVLAGETGQPLLVDPTGRILYIETSSALGEQTVVLDLEAQTSEGWHDVWHGRLPENIYSGALSPVQTVTLPSGERLDVTLMAWPGPPVVVRLIGVSTAADQVLLEMPVAARPEAMAFSRRGDRLAVLAGGRLRVVGVGMEPRRTPTAAVGRYSSDQAVGEDLVGVDRDVNALAALLCSADLRPPVTVGILGDWGSGKSFMLGRLKQQVTAYATAGRRRGFVGSMRIVDFNAWHYAEADLWASLVEQVRQVLSAPSLDHALSERDAAEQRVTRLRKRLALRRRLIWLAVAVALTLFAVAGCLAVLSTDRGDAWASALAVVATVSAGLAAATEAISRTRASVDELLAAGRQGHDVVERLYGKAAAAELDAAEAGLRESQVAVEVARVGVAEQSGAAASDGLLPALERLRDTGDYAARLTLIAHTRRLFDDLSRAAVDSSAAGQANAAEFERVLVVIDDLDRCAPEKVVDVLQAVHLLFDFPIFAVVLAVDTRWLRQALHVHYRELLAGAAADAADPMDYVEKIIQVPIQLRPLRAAQVRRMMDGLTGPAESAQEPPVPPAPAAEHTGQQPADSPARVAAPTAPAQSTVPGPREPGVPVAESEVPAAQQPAGTEAAAPIAASQLRLTPREKTMLSDLAPLVGVTPRTVKRYVNTYQLLRAREPDVDAFVAGAVGDTDAEAVAFLLAVVTGQRNAAADLFTAVQAAERKTPLDLVMDEVRPRSGASARELRVIRTWLSRRPDWASADVARFRRWFPEVSRFSFTETSLLEAASSRPR